MKKIAVWLGRSATFFPAPMAPFVSFDDEENQGTRLLRVYPSDTNMRSCSSCGLQSEMNNRNQRKPGIVYSKSRPLPTDTANGLKLPRMESSLPASPFL